MTPFAIAMTLGLSWLVLLVLVLLGTASNIPFPGAHREEEDQR